jgi:hypothetical protein
VADDEPIGQHIRGGKERMPHAQRLEHQLTYYILVGLAANDFEHPPGDHEAGVAV